VDCTLGLGGHTRALLDLGADLVIGIDRDPTALEAAARTLEPFGSRVRLVHADYRDYDAVLDRQGLGQVQGTLADLGVSSMQFDAPGRGFSFRRDEPLDMRMDQSQGETAAERLASVSETDLADVIYRFGEERKSRRVARAVVMAREREAITTTGQLAAIVRRAVAAPGWQRIDPATRTSGLRIWVAANSIGSTVHPPAPSAQRRRADGGHRSHRWRIVVKHAARPRSGSGRRPHRPAARRVERNRADPAPAAQSCVSRNVWRESGREDNVERTGNLRIRNPQGCQEQPVAARWTSAKRELLSMFGIGAVLVLVVMFDAWQHFEHIRHGYGSTLCRRRWRQERRAPPPQTRDRDAARPSASNASPDTPGHGGAEVGDAIVLERVLPAEPPARSVVVSR
jgi:16S rRNA (cytosine1402-N4)-methyltransferase